MKRDGGAMVFGPFSSWIRGIDWFWLKDGRRLIVTMETASASGRSAAGQGSPTQDPGAAQDVEPVVQMWLIDAVSGESRLLRDEKGVDAMFPVAWTGDESIACLDLPGASGKPVRVTVTDFSGGKVSSRQVAQFDGTLKQHAATRDGRVISIHIGTSGGGQILRIDTADGSARPLVTNLPTWDGLYPVWFSPDGKFAAMPDPKDGGRPWRLRLLDIAGGQLKSVDPYLEYIDYVRWSPDGRYLAYKVADVADPHHKLVEMGDSWLVLSPKVRVLEPSRNLVRDSDLVAREFNVATGHYVGGIAWLDGNTLILGERTIAEQEGAVWVADLGSADSGLKPATPAQKALLDERSYAYPMEKGSSDTFKVTVRSWQEPGKAPSEELTIAPLR